MNPTHHHILPFVLHLFAGGFLGLFCASLAGHFGWRAADRLPGESRMPQCMYCLRTYEWHDAFPMFGWLMRSDVLTLPCPCGARKGLWPQPVIEIIGFALGFAAVQFAGWSWAVAPLIVGLGLLPAIALIDLYFGIIPDELNILVAVTGFGWAQLSFDDPYATLITAAAMLALGLFLALVYSRFRGREMLGLGDVKFLAAAGFWLPLEIAPWFLAAAGITGVLFGIVWRMTGGGKELPFAPALCLSLAGCIFYHLITAPMP